MVSTSLHGLIFAEAFGIPARWVRDAAFPSSSKEGVFKFNDHLLSTRRKPNLFASSMEEAVRLAGMPPIARATLRCRQRALMLAFPFHVRPLQTTTEAKCQKGGVRALRPVERLPLMRCESGWMTARVTVAAGG